MQLGVRSLFDAGKADFSPMTDQRLAASDVLQRCRIIVSEEDTQAAAATGAIMQEYALLEEPKRIRFDRPFIWAIGDLTTGAAPYFIGLCEQP